jgi:branched-chain amino acid transport system substrate-binding protein
MKTPLRRFLFAPLLSLAACGVGGGGGDDIVLGVAGPLEKPNGRSMKLSAQMAVDEINAAGGVDGRKLRIEWGDDEGSESKAIEVAQRLRANAEVVAVVGHMNSGPSIKAAEIYNAEDNDSIAGDPVLEISPASSSPELTQAGRWTFRVTPTDLEFAPRLADWALRRLGSRRAAVLYVNDSYGQGVKESFAAAFRRGGGTVVAADPYLPAVYERDDALDPYLRRALGRGADALVIGGQATEGTRIIAAARRLGYTGPILGSDGMTGVKDAGPVAEGVFVSSAFLPDRPDPKTQKFVAEYQRRHNELPDHRGAMAYDVIYLLRDAIAEAGTGRAALRDHVARVGAEGGLPEFTGVSGKIRFDENGDVSGKEVAIGVVRGGRLVTPPQQ